MLNTSLRGLCAVSLLFGAATLSGTARAANVGNESFAVQAHVRESCEINASAILVSTEAGMATGSVFESCNTQEGFQVVAQHRWLEPSERIMVNYAGQSNVLQADGWSHVATRLGAKFGMRSISVRHSGLSEPLAIGLTITSL